MRSRGLIHATALLLTVAACTTGSVDTTVPVSTTRPQIILGGLTEADRATLIPLEGAGPLIVGSSHRGVVSADGTKVAVVTEVSDGFLVTALEVDGYSLLASTTVTDDPRSVSVSNEGTVYWLGEDSIWALTPGDDPPGRLAEGRLSGLSPFDDRITLLGDGEVGIFGRLPRGRGREMAAIVVAGPSDTVAIHDLPMVKVDQGGEPATPAAVWDVARQRVLVVEATQDVVLEFDLIAGKTTRHPWEGEARATQRFVAMSGDGRSLVVASTAADGTPLEVIALDPVGWSSGTVLPFTADRLFPSPDGRTLMARDPSPPDGPVLHLLDMGTGSVEAQIETEGVSAVQYSGDGSFAYLVGEDGVGANVDILEVASRTVVGSMGFDRLSLIAEAALVAFHR